jgi:hypothetical protein
VLRVADWFTKLSLKRRILDLDSGLIFVIKRGNISVKKRFARLFAAVFFAAAAINLEAAATITYVQGNYATPQTPQTTVNVTFTAAQAAGDLNVVVVGWNDATAVVSAVSDSSNNIYTRAVGPTVQSGTASQSIYFAKNIASAAAGKNTVTVTFASAAAYPDIRVLEYSGADPSNPVDATAANSGSSSTSGSSLVTTTNATDLIFGANLVGTLTTGPGSGFSKRLLTAPDGDIAEDKMVTAAGSYETTAPVNPAGSWIMQMVAFRTATPPTVSNVAPNSGSAAGGSAVTITGTNFAHGATVTFGNNAATSVVVVSGTRVTATTPAGSAGAVTVTVTNAGAQSGNLPKGFTYVAASQATPTALACSPTSLGSSASSACTVTLNQAAPIGGSPVAVFSSNALLSVPALVTVAAGATSATFAATTGSLSTSGSATVTATLNSVSKSTTISLVVSTTPTALTCSPTSLGPNASSACTLSLNQAAPTSGSFVTLSSSNALLTVPASFTFAAGSSSFTFTATTATFSTSQSSTITATLGGVSKTATISLVASTTPTALTCAPLSLGPSASSTCTVTLNHAAPTGGSSVTVSSSNAALSVPASVTVAAGSMAATFTAASGTIAGTQSATITASLNNVSQIATIGLVPTVGVTDSLRLSSGTAGSNGTVSLNLNLTSAPGNQETALQWTLTYSTANVVSISATAGAAVTAAGATLDCFAASGSYTCVTSGMDSTTISNGTVAIIDLVIASGVPTTPIGVAHTVGSSGAGNVITVVPSGGVVTGP